MTDLVEGNAWVAGIYQLETDDPVMGGAEGIDNLQAKQLASRTQYLLAQLLLRAPLASPTFTGDPKAPTPAAADNDTSIATTAFVKTAIADLVAASPAALDTLNELAAALGNDPNFATTITNALALKAALASPAFTGTPTAPTAAPGNNTTQLATTAFVAALGALKANLASPTFTGTPAAPTAAAGTNTTQLATTAFVQNEIAALSNTGDYKDSVRVASTSNVAAISGLLTIDGVILVAGNRVLLKDQTTASQNGIYIAAAGAWPRASDADTGAEFNGGAIIPVEEGTANADTNWQITNDGVVTIGTTGLTFQKVGDISDATTSVKGKVLLAQSSAFTGTGSPTDVPPVAAIIAGLLGDGGNSSNDYITIPYRDKTDGTLKKLIVQWCRGNVPGANAGMGNSIVLNPIVLPITFPNANLFSFVQNNVATETSGAETIEVSLGIQATTTSQISPYATRIGGTFTAGQTIGYYAIAIGY